MIDYAAAIKRFGISPDGVVHIGGFIGAEDAAYREIGFKQRLFIEAQPDTFEVLRGNVVPFGAFAERFAVSDRNGRATFRVATNGQSSSLLPMKKHLNIYGGVHQNETVEVQTIRLDDLLNTSYPALRFNFLNIDIQGAELLALSGAVQTLPQVDLVNLEVNFDELYEGAPHIRELDAFLSAFDFIRADTVMAHASWGDALYVRNRFTEAR